MKDVVVDKIFRQVFLEVNHIAILSHGQDIYGLAKKDFEYMPNSLIQNLTKSEAKNAIYLDFEGNLNKPPTYAGTVVDASYSGTFFEPIFESVAKNKKLELSTLQTFSEEIVHRAQTEKNINGRLSGPLLYTLASKT